MSTITAGPPVNAPDPWSEFAEQWTKMENSVIRLSTAEVDEYARLARLHEAPRGSLRTLVLGSTPELRTMLYRYGASPVVVERNADAYAAMTKLVPPGAREIWHQADWLRMRPEGRFDVVLADMVLSNLPFGAAQEGLLRRVRDLLTDDGVFVTRVESIKPSHVKLTLDEFFARFDKLEADDATVARFWDTAWITDNLDHPGIRVRPVYEAVIRHAKHTGHPVINRILERGGVRFPLDMAWSTHREANLLRLLEASFRIDGVGYDSGLHPDVRDFPRIYRLVKREVRHDQRR
jgi:hypothetical protein